MPVKLASDVPFSNFARQMGSLVEQMNKGFYNFCPSETWTPSVNLYENDQAYLVCVDLSGVDKEKIDLTVQNHRLRLQGVRAVPRFPGEGESEKDESRQRVRVHLMEIDYGSFCREVELPQDVVPDQISATYTNGLLWIELPKK